MRFIIVLCVALFPAIAWGEISAENARWLCRITPMGGVWVPTENPKVRLYAEEFLRKADLRVADVLLCWTANPVWSGLIKRENVREKILVIGVSDQLRALRQEHIRAWVAHEVAHWIAITPGSACEAVFRLNSKKNSDATQCEHDVDRTAMRWVGKSAMLAALDGLLSLSNMERRDKRDLSPEVFTDLTKRISLLRDVPE